MPAAGRTYGKPRRKALQIGDVVAQVQKTWEQTHAPRRPVLITPGRPAATPQIARTVERKAATVAHKQRVSTHEHDLRIARHRAKAQEQAITSLAKSIQTQGTLQKAVREQAGRSGKRTQIEKHPGLWGLISKGGTQTYRGQGLTKGTVSAKTNKELLDQLAFYRATPKEQFKQGLAKLRAGSAGAQRRASAAKTLGAGLEEASRGLYATAGGTRAAIRGEDVLKAAQRGIQKKDRYTASDVLSAAGWKPKGEIGKLARGAASFVGDVALDPLTLATGGTSSIARQGAKAALRQAAKAEAARVTEASLARGESRRVARQIAKKYGVKAGESARVRHLAQATERQQSRGAVVRYAGKTVGGRHQARATAALGRGAKQAVKPLEKSQRVGAARLKSRELLSAINAGIRPPGMTREQFLRVRQISRERRAHTETTSRRAGERATAIRAVTSAEEHDALRAAVEHGDLSSLAGAKAVKLGRRTAVRNRKAIAQAWTENPDRLRRVAEEMGVDFNRAREAVRNAGIPVGHVGVKPPVHIPEVTVDLKAERKALGKARAETARAEREALAQRMPGGEPGPLTPAQVTRATRQLKRATTAKAGHLNEFKRVSAQIKDADPETAVKLRARQRIVRSRVRAAQDEIEHWKNVLTKRTTATKPLLHETGKVVRGQAPRRAAVPAARTRQVEAEKLLGEARTLRSGQLKAQRSATRRAAVRAGEPKGYWPRVANARVEARGPATLEDILGPPHPGGATGSKRPKPSHALPRKFNKPIEVLRQGTPEQRRYAEKFSSDPALVYQTYMAGMGRGEAQAIANRALIAEGTPVTPGKAIKLGEGERVYRREGANLHELDPNSSAGLKEMGDIEAGGGKPDEYVVLPKAMHDYVNPGAAGASKAQAVSDAWGSLWGKWKGVALKTPAYLMRNMTGDLFNGLGAQDPARLARNWMRGQRALNERARSDRGYKWFESEMGKGGKGTMTTVNGERVRYRDLAVLAEAAGVIGQGRLGEAAEQAGAMAKKLQRPRGTSAWRQAAQRVEDSARMGTFIGMLERGMAPEQAADVVRDVHFDYGELTSFEKNVRNVAMPFYTFSSRNIPYQLKLAATRPGVPLAVQHAREEGTKESGIDPNFLDKLDPYEARQLSVPIKWRGKTYTVSTGAPISDLSTLAPVGDLKDPRSWLKAPVVGLGQRGMELLGPAKTLFEVMQNHSIFYQEPIAPKGARLTAVHPLIAKMADEIPGFAAAVGIKPKGVVDKETGKFSWAWDKRKEAALRSLLPGPFGAAYRTSAQATSPRGFSPTAEALGTLAGVRAKEYVSGKADLNQLYNRLRDVELKIGDIHQGAINLKTSPTLELKKLEAEKKQLGTQLEAIKKQRQKFYKGRWQGAASPRKGPLPVGGGGQKLLPVGGGGRKLLPIG